MIFKLTADPSKLLKDLLHILKCLFQKRQTLNLDFLATIKLKIILIGTYSYLQYLFETELWKEKEKGLPDSKHIEIRNRCIKFIIKTNQWSNQAHTI